MTTGALCLRGAALLGTGECRTFEYDSGGEELGGFVLRHESGLFAYQNRCPHWSVDLDMGDGRFYAEDIDRIYCKTHGALFRVVDGYCDHGPCHGKALSPFLLTIDGDDVWVTLERAQ